MNCIGYFKVAVFVYAPLHSFKSKAERLAKLQRQLKNKKKFSNNWKKVKAKISQCHEDIGNARKDYLHKVSTEISENQAIILTVRLILHPVHEIRANYSTFP